MYAIYTILNPIENKYYIGFSKAPNDRHLAHLRMLRNGKHHSYKFQKAYDDKLIKDLEFKIIKNNISAENVEQEEIKSIGEYNSYNNGYNCTEGGNINLTGQKSWKNKFGGEHNVAKKVYQYTREGNFIKEWGSVIDAARSFGVENSHIISKCCKGQFYHAYNYYWRYQYKGENINVPKKIDPKCRAVIMIDSETNKELQTFSSAKVAQDYLKANKNKIFAVCKGERQHWAGYKWKYA